MWDKILRYLPMFSSAVLTVVDAQGYPFSVRCRFSLEPVKQRLMIQVSPQAGFRPGPACLLCHYHDERLWNLKSLQVRGMLEQDTDGWSLMPGRLIPGMGIEGIRSYIKFVLDGRRTAKKFLQQRGLERPRIPWHEYEQLAAWAVEEGKV